MKHTIIADEERGFNWNIYDNKRYTLISINSKIQELEGMSWAIKNAFLWQIYENTLYYYIFNNNVSCFSRRSKYSKQMGSKKILE